VLRARSSTSLSTAWLMSVIWFVWMLTSSATTANPSPASPARAASISPPSRRRLRLPNPGPVQPFCCLLACRGDLLQRGGNLLDRERQVRDLVSDGRDCIVLLCRLTPDCVDAFCNFNRFLSMSSSMAASISSSISPVVSPNPDAVLSLKPLSPLIFSYYQLITVPNCVGINPSRTTAVGLRKKIPQKAFTGRTGHRISHWRNRGSSQLSAPHRSPVR